jgi:hypothetical protein
MEAEEKEFEKAFLDFHFSPNEITDESLAEIAEKVFKESCLEWLRSHDTRLLSKIQEVMENIAKKERPLCSTYCTGQCCAERNYGYAEGLLKAASLLQEAIKR